MRMSQRCLGHGVLALVCGKRLANAFCRRLPIQSSACLLPYVDVFLLASLKDGIFAHESREHHLLRTLLCRGQYTVLLPSGLKHGFFVQETCEERTLRTFAIPSSTWFLHNDAVLLRTLLMFGRLLQEPCMQRVWRMSTIPSSASCLECIVFLFHSH